MATADMLDRVTTRLTGWEVQPSEVELLEDIQTISDRVCLRVGAGELPALAESIVVDATVKMLNRVRFEGISSESVGQTGTITTSFVDDILAEYADELSSLSDLVDDGGTGHRPPVRFI